MKVLETKLVKLIADEGKVIVPKEKEYDEEGNLLQQNGAKIVCLPNNISTDEFIEIDEEVKGE